MTTVTQSEQNHKTKKIFSGILKYLIPLIISISLCYLLFTGIDFNEMISIIRNQCDFRWIGLAMGISIFSHIFRALRWKIQLKALGITPPTHALVYSIFGTYAVNLVFPRLGEVWRSGYIANREKAPFTTVFGSMMAERLADTVTVALLTIITFLLATKGIMSFMEANGDSYNNILELLTYPPLWIGVSAIIATLWWFMAHKSSNSKIIKIQNAVKDLWKGFAVIGKMPNKGMWLFWTFAIWGAYFTQLYVAFYAFPFTSEILAQHGILAALVTFVLSSISMGVPSNGGIGPWQWAVIFSLGIYGLDNVNAGAFANLVLGSQTLLLIALGIFTFIAITFDKKRNKQSTSNNQQ